MRCVHEDLADHVTGVGFKLRAVGFALGFAVGLAAA
jgi:hypothetical protein